MRTPQRVTGLEGQMIKKVSCGEMHSLALSVAGEVFMWGLLPETRHVRNDGMFDHASVSLTGLSQGAMISAALREHMTGNIMHRLMRDSELVYESANMQGGGGGDALQDLGQQKVQTVRHPCFVPRACPSLARVIIINIAAGFAHSLASSLCGAVFSCGYNDNGQLGTGSRRNSADFQQVKALDGFFIEHIACGQQHSLACSRIEIAPEVQQKSGVCFSWGLGILGQLGSGINISWLPMRVDIAEPIVSVAAGSHHSVVVSNAGHVYSWGHSEYGQHGAGEMFYDLQRGAHYFYPRVQESLKAQGVCVKRVACSSHSTFALASDGNVYSWGWNAFGVLGVGKYQHSVHPQKVFGLKDNTATHIGAGSNHGAAVVRPRGAHYSLRYDQVLKNGEFADIEFVVHNGGNGGGETRERAHRVVLCARSGYLRGLLRVIASSSSEPEAVDEESKVLVVDEFQDVDAQVLRSFLMYLYTNRVEIPNHKRKALAGFAARVCLDDLMNECQDMWRKRRPENSALELDEVRQFGNDMQTMVLASEFSDVEFLWPIQDEDGDAEAKADGEAKFERLPAHKAVLSQVDYFRTMFTGGFSEGTSYSGPAATVHVHEIELNYMHRDGVSLAAFKNLLLWIYTGSFERLKGLEPNEMMDLYVGASLIGLGYLASLCELQLAAILAYLDKDSIAACLDFAERYDARRLRTLSQQLLDKKTQDHDQKLTEM